MRTIEKLVYKLNELSDEAKKNALEDYIINGLHYKWYNCIIDDTKEIGKILGIDISNVYFSGFYSQGDGACFEGTYQYEKQSVQKIKEYAPLDTDLHQIAENLRNIQRKYFYQLYVTIKHSGRYYHPLSTNIYVETQTNGFVGIITRENISEVLRDFMHWIYNRLEREYEYLTSMESFAETSDINEWEYDENGKFI